MNIEKRTLENVRALAIDMMNKINEDGGYYIKDLSYEVEELISQLDLDMIFIPTEIQELKKNGFKVSLNKTVAKIVYNKVPVSIAKSNWNEYQLLIGRASNRKSFNVDMDELKYLKHALKSAVKDFKER